MADLNPCPEPPTLDREAAALTTATHDLPKGVVVMWTIFLVSMVVYCYVWYVPALVEAFG